VRVEAFGDCVQCAGWGQREVVAEQLRAEQIGVLPVNRALLHFGVAWRLDYLGGSLASTTCTEFQSSLFTVDQA